VAAYLGARPEPVDWTVWFHPEKEQEAGDIRLAIDPNNAWLRRVKDICRAAIARWEGMVQVGMTDLGGNLDVLSTFRPGEKLLLDLVDFPDEVKRLAWEAHAAWWKAFDDINSVLRPVNPGYTSWASIFSEKPNYMLQCDFSYMIGPEMFDEFARPELEASCQRLSQSFYHLDGVGQLPHLDLLLAIKELNGVQWVPGGGKPPCECWPEVYRKIIKAGKRAHFIGNWRDFDRLVDQVGGAENFFLSGTEPPENRREVEAFLKRYGVM
jgi:5-methyltetrahydrofolate--homocysteine methyltransferase